MKSSANRTIGVMRNMCSPTSVAGVLLSLLCGCATVDQSASAPVMSCAYPDSLVEGSIRYSDEIHGVALSAGGTRAALLPDSSGWRVVLIPVSSDFPDEPGLWGGGEEPETLAVTWRSVAAARGVVFPRVLPIPRDTTPADSIVFTADCQALSLLMWERGKPFGTFRLPRPGYWP